MEVISIGNVCALPNLQRCGRGGSGGAMMLSKIPVPGRPTNLDDSGARAYCACTR